MKALVVSDQAVDRIYELMPQGHFVGVKMVLACGDLPYDYLEYIVTILNVPLFYVPGNHDPAYQPQLASAHAAGCINLDLRTTRSQGQLLAGFGGSIRYRANAANQYSQAAAFWRATALVPGLVRNRLAYGRFLDVFVTHSPPYGIHDDDSSAHRGLKVINWILRWAKPSYHLHGHMHDLRRNLAPDVARLGSTAILNVFPYRMIEIQDAA